MGQIELIHKLSTRMLEPRQAKAEWLQVYAARGFMTACRETGAELFEVADWMECDPGFREARAIADRISGEMAEDRLRAMAEGEQPCTTPQVSALSLRLRALRPDRYGNVQRVELTGAGGGAVRVDGSASRAVELLAAFTASRAAAALPAPAEDADDAAEG
jgi:hypothetical protein